MRRSLDFVVAILLSCSWCIALPAGVSADIAAGDARRSAALLERVEIPFVRNEGQYPAAVAYYARTFGGVFFVTRDGQMVVSLPAEKDGGADWVVIREEAVAGSGASPRGLERSPTRVSNFIGNDPGAWQQGVPTFHTISLGEVYEGIELRLKAYGNRVEKIFVVQPGVDPDRIKLRTGGIEGLTVDQDGALRLGTAHGTVTYSAPVAYQETERGTHHVPVAYAIDGDTYGFELGPYDKARPLVIDPILSATYLGGSADDPSWSLAFDSSGNVYVAGRTFSTDFPGVDASSAQTSKLGFQDVYVAKFNPGLNVLYHATYLGGTGSEEPGTGDGGGPSIAVHPVTDNVYVTGWTSSSDFPVTANGWQNTKDAGMDAYITILENSLDTVVRSTYFGGGDEDIATALDFHPVSGDVCITGRTRSTDLPGVSGGAQASHSGGTWDGFAACFSSDLTPLRQATYLGGVGEDWPLSITVHDKSGETNYGSIYITGNTDSAIFPNALANTSDLGGGTDAFVTYLPADLSQLVWMHRIGGTGQDRGYSIDVHPLTGEVYVSGTTSSTDFPGTDDFAAQPDLGGASDGFISNMSAGLSVQRAATYFGGSNSETAGTLSINPTTGDVYLVGNTISTDIPGTTGGAQVDNAGDMDVYIARHSADLSTLLQATYVGGSSRDMGYAVGINPLSDEVYVTGLTWSGNFPTWTGSVPAAQPNHGGGNQDGYVMRLDGTLAATGAPDIDVNPLSVDFGATEVETVVEKDMLIANTGAEDLSVSAISLSDDLNFDFDLDVVVGVISPCGDFAALPDLFQLPAGQECSLVLTFQPSELGLHKADLLIRSDDPDEGELTVALEGTGGSVPDINLTPLTHDFGAIAVGETSSADFVLANIGASDLVVDDLYLSNGVDFDWDASDCSATVPFVLSARSQCTVTVQFAPTDEGSTSAYLDISSNDPDEATVRLTFTGGSDVQDVDVEPVEIDFGEVRVGYSSEPVLIVIKNLGRSVLEVRDIHLDNAEICHLFFPNLSCGPTEANLDFGLDFISCDEVPFYLGDGQECTVQARFRPQPGTINIDNFNEDKYRIYSADLIIVTSDPDEPEVAVRLDGSSPGAPEPGCSSGCSSGRGSGLPSSSVLLVLAFILGNAVWRRRGKEIRRRLG